MLKFDLDEFVYKLVKLLSPIFNLYSDKQYGNFISLESLICLLKDFDIYPHNVSLIQIKSLFKSLSQDLILQINKIESDKCTEYNENFKINIVSSSNYKRIYKSMIKFKNNNSNYNKNNKCSFILTNNICIIDDIKSNSQCNLNYNLYYIDEIRFVYLICLMGFYYKINIQNNNLERIVYLIRIMSLSNGIEKFIKKNLIKL